MLEVRAMNQPNQTKIVDLTAHRARIAEREEVKLGDITPTAQDVESFLKVLRYLQNKTNANQAEIESNADGLTVSLTEYHTVEGDQGSTIEYTTTTRKIFIPFPFMLMDLDPSELTTHPSGKNTVELFCESMAALLHDVDHPSEG